MSKRRPTLGAVIYFAVCMSLGVSFMFAAVQGDYGLFQRLQYEAEARVLRAELTEMQTRVADLENKTHRLSDEFLDLDLLDEQARRVLGLTRGDEIVIN